jgi:histidinol-phosphatase (PHP family)
MIDAHIHIERGPYTLQWINEFVKIAQTRGIDEIWLLEHCYRFSEFVPMYDSVCAYSDYIDKWFHRKAGVLKFSDYLELIETVRNENYPVKIRFGLEVCYFKKHEKLVREITDGKGLDFLVGSVHFIDYFAFDHKAEFWDGTDVDKCYRRYFETSVELVESRLFDGIAHPDCIKLFGHKPSFSLLLYYEKLAVALHDNGMYAEQSSGIHRRADAEIGMNRDMVAAMKSHNVRIVTASDAHCPEDVGLYLKEAEELIWK